MTASPIVSPVSLAELGRTHVATAESNLIYRGRVAHLVPYSQATDALTFDLDGIHGDPGHARVYVHGECATRLDRLVVSGNVILLHARGGVVQPAGTSDRVHIAYGDRGVSGYLLPDEVSFNFSRPLAARVLGRTMVDKAVQTSSTSTPTAKRQPERARKAKPTKKRAPVKDGDALMLDASEGKKSDHVAYTLLASIRDGSATGSGKHFALVVVSADVQPPRADGDPWFVLVTVTDPSLVPPTALLDASPVVTELQWYENNPKKIPKFEPKDVLIVRNMYVSKEKQKIVRGAQYPSPFMVLKPLELCDPDILPSLAARPFRDATNVELSQIELHHAVQLARFYRKRPFPNRPPESHTSTRGSLQHPETFQAPSPKLAKLREIKDVEADCFCDIYAEILKCFIPVSPHEPISLYVTDYTRNPALVEYSPASALANSLLPGQLTLQVSVFGPTQARPFAPAAAAAAGGGFSSSSSERGDLVGQCVRIDNLRPKENARGWLEATIVDDQTFRDKELVKLIPNGSRAFAAAKPIQELLK
ncbi:hypothetical protein JCM11491_003170 [Sporobolomyces phaffii]